MESKTKKELMSFADMLEARKRLGICAGLRVIPRHALTYSSVVDVKVRILRAILPTIEDLYFSDGGGLDDQDCAHMGALFEREHVLAPKLTGLYFDYAFMNCSSAGAARIFQSMATNSSAFKNLSAFKNVRSLYIGDKVCRGMPYKPCFPCWVKIPCRALRSSAFTIYNLKAVSWSTCFTAWSKVYAPNDCEN